LKEILEEKKNELSPHLKIPPFFLQNSFNPKEPKLHNLPARCFKGTPANVRAAQAALIAHGRS
jgi:hypothetical protein